MKLTCLTCMAVAGVLAGCASTSPTRIAADTIGAAGGAFLGHTIGKGNPLVTAAGAGVGVLLGESLHAGSTRANETSYAAGYEKGRSDSAKQRYQSLLDQQREPSSESFDRNISLFKIPLPERKVDGARLNSGTAILRVQE